MYGFFYSYLFVCRNCLSSLSLKPNQLSQYYGELLGNSSDFVRNFAAKTFTIVLRKLKSKSFVSHVSKVLTAASANIELVSNKDIDMIGYPSVLDEEDHDPTEKRAKWLLHGLSSLLFSVLKGIKGQLQLKGVSYLNELFSIFEQFSDAEDNIDPSTGHFRLKVLSNVFCRLLRMLHQHVYSNGQESLLAAEFAFIRSCIVIVKANCHDTVRMLVAELCNRVVDIILRAGRGKVLYDADVKRAVSTDLITTSFDLFESMAAVSAIDFDLLRSNFSAIVRLYEGHKVVIANFSRVVDALGTTSDRSALINMANELKQLPGSLFQSMVFPALMKVVMQESEQQLDIKLNLLFALEDFRESTDQIFFRGVARAGNTRDTHFFAQYLAADFDTFKACLKKVSRKKVTSGEIAVFVASAKFVLWTTQALTKQALTTVLEEKGLDVETLGRLLLTFSTQLSAADNKSEYVVFVLSELVASLPPSQEVMSQCLTSILSQLINDGISSFYLASACHTLLQWMSRNISATYWISESLTENEVADFIQKTSQKLVSCHAWHRIALLRLLKHVEPPCIVNDKIEQEEQQYLDVVTVMYEIATMPVSIESEREMLRRFEIIEVMSRDGKLGLNYSAVVSGFCVGMLNVKFKPIWQAVMQVILTLSKDELMEQQLWNCIERGFIAWDVEHDSHDNEILIEENPTANDFLESLNSSQSSFGAIPIAVKESIWFPLKYDEQTRSMAMAPDAENDGGTKFSQLLDLLSKAPWLTMKYSKFVVPLFFQFLERYYQRHCNEIEIPVLRSIGLLSSEATSDIHASSVNPKVLRTKLVSYLKVFAAITSPKQLFRYQFLYAFFHELVRKTDLDLSKQALECILTFKPAHLIPYKDHLKGLLDDRKSREVMLIISSSLEGNRDVIVAPEHQPMTFKFMTSLCYGKLISKTSADKKEREVQNARRTATLAFISQLGEESAHFFLALMLRGLVPSSWLVDATTQYLKNDVLDANQAESFAANGYSSILSKLLTINTIDLSQTSWERIKGFLYFLEPAVSNFGFIIKDMVPVVHKVLLEIFQVAKDTRNATLNITSADDVRNDVDEEETQEIQQHRGKTGDRAELVIANECRTLAIKRLTELLEQYHTIYAFNYGAEILIESLKPLVTSLKAAVHSSNKPPAILLLLEQLSQYPSTLPFITNNIVCIENILSCLSIAKTSPESMKILLKMIERILNCEGGKYLAPHAELIVEMYVQRWRGGDMIVDGEDVSPSLRLSDVKLANVGSNKDELALLCRMANELFSNNDQISQQSAHQFSTIILGMLRCYTTSPKARISDEWVINILHVYRAFLDRMEDISAHCAFISRCFGPSVVETSCLNSAAVRSELLIVYGMMANHPSTSELITPSFRVLNGITKQEFGLSEGRDYATFMPYMQALAADEPRDVDGTLISWDALLGPAAMQRDSVGRQIAEQVSISTSVLFESIRCMYDSEMAVRSSALQVLKRLVALVVEWCNTSMHEESIGWECVLKTFIVPALRKGIQSSIDIIRGEFLSLLSHLVSSCRESATVSALMDHMDLALLQHEDAEQDFFRSACHIQMHRRARAFLKLQRYLKSDDFALTTPSLVHILLPLVFSYFTSAEEFSSKKLHQHVLDEVVQLTGAICFRLPWNHYLTVFKKVTRLLERAQSEKIKLLQTLLCCILDNFHFDLNAPMNITVDVTAAAADNDDEAVIEDEDETEEETAKPAEEKGIADGEEKADEAIETPPIITEESKDPKQGIVHSLVHFILPSLKRYLLKEVKDHKGNKTKLVQPHIAIAMTNLLKHLTPPIIPNTMRNNLLSGMVITVVNTLKSRDSDVRDAARQCLAKIVMTLGLSSLHTIIFELQSNLREGYQRHVVSHSVRSILSTVLEKYNASSDAKSGWNTAHDDNLDNAQVFITKEEISQPDFDACIPLIMEIVNEDLSEDMRADREAEGGARANAMREMKGSKFAEILEVTARCLLFRPTYALVAPNNPASVSSIHAISVPLLEALQQQQLRGEQDTAGLAGRISEALQRVASGLAHNTSVLDKELLLYVHATLQPFVTQMLTDYRRYREAMGKLQTTGGTKMAVDEDSDFEVDLPSYLRAEESDDEETFEFMKKKRFNEDEDGVDKQRAALWLPTDARSLKEQRAVVMERKRVQQEQFRVQDGAAAPKLTGRNRYDLQHRRGRTATGIAKTTLIAIRFCLTVLHSSLKGGLFHSNDVAIQGMLMPFLPMLRSFLHIPGASEVVSLSIKLIGTLVTWGLEMDYRLQQRLSQRVLSLMLRHCATITTENELCQASIRTLLALFRSFNKQMATYEQEKSKNKADKPVFPLPEDKLRALVELLTLSITEITGQFQHPSFQLIKEIVRSRAMLPELYDLIKNLAEQIVLSQRAGIREASAQIVVTFLVTYPMTNKRHEAQLLQLIQNCDYEFEEGRKAALETVQQVLSVFPIAVVEKHAFQFFFPMALKLVNEQAQSCRKAVVNVLSTFLRRLQNNELLKQCQEFALQWLSTVQQHAEDDIWGEECLGVLRSGAQVIAILLPARPECAKQGDYLQKTIDTIFMTLQLFLLREESSRSMQGGEQELIPRYWQSIYQLLLTIEQLYRGNDAALSNAVDRALCQACSSISDSSRNHLMDLVMDLLLYRQPWVRAVSVRILLPYLTRRLQRLPWQNASSTTKHYELLQQPNVFYQLMRKFCLLLNQGMLPTGMKEALPQAILLLLQLMIKYPKLDTYDEHLAAENNNNGNENNDNGDEENDQVEEDDLFAGEEPANEEQDLETLPLQAPLVPPTAPEEGDEVASIPKAMGRKKGKRVLDADEDKEMALELVAVDKFQAESLQTARRGLTWTMHRLRAIGADIRGERRSHVLRTLHLFMLTSAASPELVHVFAAQLLEPSVRVVLSSKQPMTSTATADDEEEALRLQTLAKDVMQRVEDILGAEPYMAILANVQREVQRRKQERRTQAKALAISDPQAYNQFKVRSNVYLFLCDTDRVYIFLCRLNEMTEKD